MDCYPLIVFVVKFLEVNKIIVFQMIINLLFQGLKLAKKGRIITQIVLFIVR